MAKLHSPFMQLIFAIYSYSPILQWDTNNKKGVESTGKYFYLRFIAMPVEFTTILQRQLPLQL